MLAEFTERDDEVIRVFRYNAEGSIFFKTEKQDVAILDTLLFGRTLFLDGILQSAEKDEEIYHRALVHPVMSGDSAKKNILVIGGGEGATLRELLKWQNVGHITMLDWDKELVEYFRRNEFHWHRGAFEDPRITLEFRDIFEAVQEDRKYDVIIVDLVDPDMSDSKWRDLFKRLVGWLGVGGIMSVNAGGVFPWDTGDVPAICEVLKEGMGGAVHHVAQHKKWVPSFGREWAFVILKNY